MTLVKVYVQTVCSEDNSGANSQVPLADQHYALCLLLELATQKASLSNLLEAVLLLLHLHTSRTLRTDNRSDELLIYNIFRAVTL